MEQLKEQLCALSAELEEKGGMSGMANGKALRSRAGVIATIGLRHLKGVLLHRCLGIANAIADFAEELEEPSD